MDISDESKKVFTEPFIDAVRALNEVIAKGSLRQQVAEFRRFVNEFGTHYASSTELGTKLTIERRYTLHERQGVKNKALKDCNTLAGDSDDTCFLIFDLRRHSRETPGVNIIIHKTSFIKVPEYWDFKRKRISSNVGTPLCWIVTLIPNVSTELSSQHLEVSLQTVYHNGVNKSSA